MRPFFAAFHSLINALTGKVGPGAQVTGKATNQEFPGAHEGNENIAYELEPVAFGGSTTSDIATTSATTSPNVSM